MSQTKICPDCKSEYYAHIEKCADCGTTLLFPGESRSRSGSGSGTKSCGTSCEHGCGQSGHHSNDPEVVGEGDQGWMYELAQLLERNRVPHVVAPGISTAESGCNKGCCGSSGTWQLLVPGQYAQEASDLIEEYYINLHPEVQEAGKLASPMSNKATCPACGFFVGPCDAECPDCGLSLVVTEKKKCCR